MVVNIEDKELVKMFNPTLKRIETILFFLIVVTQTIQPAEPKGPRVAPNARLGWSRVVF